MAVRILWLLDLGTLELVMKVSQEAPGRFFAVEKVIGYVKVHEDPGYSYFW